MLWLYNPMARTYTSGLIAYKYIDDISVTLLQYIYIAIQDVT